jgi:hypothetical protein
MPLSVDARVSTSSRVAASSRRAPLLGVASLFVGDHHDRTTFLAVAGGFAAAMAVVGILIGLFFWWACAGDIRRCRDWRTVRGQAGPVTVAAPVLLRIGVLALVLFPGALGLITWWMAPGTTAGGTATEPRAPGAGAQLGRRRAKNDRARARVRQARWHASGGRGADSRGAGTTRLRS